MLRILDLFSGVGGLSLAFERAGAQTAAFSEIDPHASRVLAHRWPDTPNLGDITRITGGDVLDRVGPVDVVTGGFPCQDLSVAGKRAGLAGERSGLFWQIVRIVRELQGASHGPTFVVLENVPGLSSSHGGRDMAAVLAGLLQCGARDVAWGVLDARWFGVPQRRRRVFIVADFGAERAAEILALAESVRGDSPLRGTARQGAAAATGDSVAGGGGLAGTLGGGSGSRGWCNDTERMTFVPEYAQPNALHRLDSDTYISVTAPTLKRHYAKGIDTTVDTAPVEGAGASEDGTGRGVPIMVPAGVLRVRRLTPLECERLQGFPDGWTDCGLSDSARYRCLGNAVAVPVVEWIARRMVAVAEV